MSWSRAARPTGSSLRGTATSLSDRACGGGSRRAGGSIRCAMTPGAPTRTGTTRWSGRPRSRGRTATSGWPTAPIRAWTQYLVAPTRPPHLKALFARQADTGWYGGHNYRGGAHDLCRRRKWSFEQVLIQLEHRTAPPGVAAARARLREALDEIERWYWHLPLKSCPPLEGLADWYFDILDHPEDGPYWQPMNIVPHFGEIDVPIFHLGGWFDMFISGTLRMFQGVREQGRTEACRAAQRVVIGPWQHGQANIGQQQTGEVDFGAAAAFDQNEYWLRWYDYWLKGVDTGIMELPPVRVFLMGANRWLDLAAWPPPDVTYQPIYFPGGYRAVGDLAEQRRADVRRAGRGRAAGQLCVRPGGPGAECHQRYGTRAARSSVGRGADADVYLRRAGAGRDGGWSGQGDSVRALDGAGYRLGSTPVRRVARRALHVGV